LDYETDMIIYICGAIRDRYNPNPRPIIENVKRGIDIGIQVYLKGHIPIIPMLHYYMNQLDKEKYGEKLKWADYMYIDYHSLLVSDAILKISSSHGADLEEKWMLNHNKKVYYDISDIPSGFKTFPSESEIEVLFKQI
jgi:hypothetical protein